MEDVEVSGKSPETVGRQALRKAKKEARLCGQYERGDRLWVNVWDENEVVHTFSDTI